jgi:uncharacterized protein with ParB-like and HNH nuclease domain
MPKDFSFEASDRKIEQVLFSQRKFRVPRYQRPYAWGIEQITELWNDLITNSEPYFLGSFVFCTENEQEDGCAEIIDGQQRLLTITIFAAVLRDLAKLLESNIAALYHRQDIAIEDRYGKQSFRVTPDDPLAGYYTKHIQNIDGDIKNSIPKTPEEIRVKQNYEYLYEKMEEELKRYDSKEAKINKLDHFRKKVSDLVVIDVEISRDEDAYEIFETTNARGVDLSVSDLLKNLIFKKIQPGKDRDFAKDMWQEITNNIQATDTELKRFIRHYWLSKYSLVTEKQLYREIRNKTTDWEGLLSDLWESSEIYNALLEGNEEEFQKYRHGSKIFDSLFSLRLMEVSQCYVLLLSLLRNYDKLETDPVRIFQLIEKFTFQYSVVCSLPGNRPEKIYAKYAGQIEDVCKSPSDKGRSGKIQSIFSSLERELQAEKPSYNVFKESFADVSYRNSEKSRKLIKYILGKTDSYYRLTYESRIDFNNVNIEHILPQNPDKTWGLTKGQIKRYVNKIGNLTLVDKRINSKVQNKMVNEKLKDLEQSTLPITIELVAHLKKLNGQWGENEIDERQYVLCSIAYNNIWNF